MSQAERVASAIIGRDVTIKQLLPEFPDMTHAQLQQCMTRAKQYGLVEIVSRSNRGRKAVPTVFRGLAPKPVEPKTPTVRITVSCVWQLAGQGISLPKASGQKYQPLGEW